MFELAANERTTDCTNKVCMYVYVLKLKHVLKISGSNTWNFQLNMLHFPS